MWEPPLTEQTLAGWYDECAARVYRYALALLANHADAEDAVQEAFVQLGKVLSRRAPPELSFGYLATIVRNECYTALRKRRRRDEVPAPLLEPASPDASEEERMFLEEALRALPAEQREVMYLKVFEGMTFQEIADRCGIGINTAASRYRYGAAAMRRALEPLRNPAS
jgi:RNA polymerase sigma-70 factor (ECF subfamily)